MYYQDLPLRDNGCGTHLSILWGLPLERSLSCCSSRASLSRLTVVVGRNRNMKGKRKPIGCPRRWPVRCSKNAYCVLSEHHTSVCDISRIQCRRNAFCTREDRHIGHCKIKPRKQKGARAAVLTRKVQCTRNKRCSRADRHVGHCKLL